MFKSTLFFCLASVSVWAQINSPYDEQNPMLTPDGREVYFTVGRHPLNVSGIRDLGDIWYSKLENGSWSAPMLVNGMINNGGYNTVLGFSEDGNEMYLYGHYSANGSPSGSQGISVSKRSSGGWSLPMNEEVLYFRNTSTEASGYITPDKSLYIFSADSRMSHGNEDIYISFNENGHWTEPKNLGTHINTGFQELTPWLSVDRRTLYFATNAQTKYGSFDIYAAERLDDSWANWSSPRNMGSSVNSSGKDTYYHPYESRKFVTSTHNSDGYGDIVEFDLKRNDVVAKPVVEEIPPVKPPIVQTEPEQKPITPNPTTGLVVHGKVINAQDNTGIPAIITFNSTNSLNAGSGNDGSYQIALDPKATYTVRVEAKGYIGAFEKFTSPAQDVHDVEVNFKLQPVVVGAGMSLKNVLFKQSTPILLPESFDELEMVYDFMALNPNVEIELGGHTDNGGKAALNLKLSKDRVTRVKNYLVEKGIDARRIKGVGYGETKPIASNKTDEGKRLNRRVEFKIISVTQD